MIENFQLMGERTSLRRRVRSECEGEGHIASPSHSPSHLGSFGASRQLKPAWEIHFPAARAGVVMPCGSRHWRSQLPFAILCWDWGCIHCQLGFQNILLSKSDSL